MAFAIWISELRNKFLSPDNQAIPDCGKFATDAQNTCDFFSQFDDMHWIINMMNIRISIIAVVIGGLSGAMQGWEAKGTSGVLPAVFAGVVGAFLGAMSCAYTSYKITKQHDASITLIGALVGTLGSEAGRPELSCIGGIVSGCFFAALICFSQKYFDGGR